jgi:dihydroxyacetone kinase-like protein
VKKLVDDPANAVTDSLAGFALAHADTVAVHGIDPSTLARTGPVYATRKQPAPHGTVAVISGGGSGHEPLHIGFIGEGMLDAAVPGPMFTSPTPDCIYEAIRAAHAGAGVLLIVKNYTGDVLNFDMAADLAADDGIAVRTVIVEDDVAVENSLHTIGRRGVAGTLLVEKIAGAAAARGDCLDDVAAVAQHVIDNVRSMGVALTPCTVPQIGRPSFDLPADEIEIGIGIHGEPGRYRAPVAPASTITRDILDPVIADLRVNDGEKVLLYVNGMGATPLSELYIIYGAARRLCDERGIIVDRSLVGDYVTSLEMQGASVTLLRLDDELTALWDAPVNTVTLAW